MGRTELLHAVRQIKDLQIFIKDLEKELDGVKQTIINEMNAQQVNEMVIDVFTIRYTSYITNRVNTPLLKEQEPTIYDRYTQAVEAKRLTIS